MIVAQQVMTSVTAVPTMLISAATVGISLWTLRLSWKTRREQKARMEAIIADMEATDAALFGGPVSLVTLAPELETEDIQPERPLSPRAQRRADRGAARDLQKLLRELDD